MLHFEIHPFKAPRIGVRPHKAAECSGARKTHKLTGYARLFHLLYVLLPVQICATPAEAVREAQRACFPEKNNKNNYI
jgi:hypothetical protein